MEIKNSNQNTLQKEMILKKDGLKPQFWVANIMELFERLAYYGQATILSIFLRDHLNFNEFQAGQLSSLFGGLIYLLPIFAAALADKFGFRKAFSFAFLVLAMLCWVLWYFTLPAAQGVYLNPWGDFKIALGITILILGIFIFSIGEQTQVPRFYEFIADMVPAGQAALFQGYAFLPIALGSVAQVRNVIAMAPSIDGSRNNLKIINIKNLWIASSH